jgi:malate dehydrogenase (oxaloacetate-decarboxylating)
MPVMEGKAVLFQEFADVDAFPICLDTNDVDEIVAIVKAMAPTFGGINLEDISAPRCILIEKRLKEELDIPVFHDDQHGTDTVVASALMNACKLTKRSIQESKIVVNGAGAAGSAITKILLSMGAQHVLVCDRKGILYRWMDWIF